MISVGWRAQGGVKLGCLRGPSAPSCTLSSPGGECLGGHLIGLARILRSTL